MWFNPIPHGGVGVLQLWNYNSGGPAPRKTRRAVPYERVKTDVPDATAKLEEREVEPEKAAEADKKGKKKEKKD